MLSGIMPAILRSAPEPHGSWEAAQGSADLILEYGLLFSFQGPSSSVL
jgi:hypothetical protein